MAHGRERIETCPVMGEPETHLELAAQVAEVERLRVTVGRLPAGTRIAWRDDSRIEDAEGTITDASADFGYRLDTGVFVLWKSHNVRVLALPGPAAPAKSAPQPQSNTTQEGKDVIMTPTPKAKDKRQAGNPRRDPATGRAGTLTDEERAARLAYVEDVDRLRAEGRAMPDVVALLAARPPYCNAREVYNAHNYRHWREVLAGKSGRPDRMCECGKRYAPTGNSQKYCAECAPEKAREKKNRLCREWTAAKRKAKAVVATRDAAEKRLAAAQGACKPAAAPVQPPGKPPAESATPTSDLRLPPSDLAATAVEQAAAIVRGVIEAIMDARPVRYELIGRAAEIGRELDREINELAALVADAKTTREG